jgi:nucleoside-diphosphate-sugar epimerase
MVEYLVTKMLARETCYIGTPDSVRDYMFAEDHVSAYVLVARNPKAVGAVYNVSPGNPVTNKDVVEKLADMTGFKGKIAWGAYPPGYPQRPPSQDPAYLALDSSKISKDLGWKPRYSLDEGLRATIDMWKTEVRVQAAGAFNQ